MTNADLTIVEGLLAQLIAFPTESADSNRALIDWAEDYLRSHGARTRLVEDETGAKANLFASFGPEADGGIVLSGHTDVVPADASEWTSDPYTMAERDGLLYGRGTCDMKGFIACVMAMAAQFAAWPLTRPIHIALTYDEETGCLGAQSLVREMAAWPHRPAIAIIGEPTLMGIINGHKGCYEYTTDIKGAEGHGSAPDLGVNAAVNAARYVGRLMELAAEMPARAAADCPFDPPWTTVNIGQLHAGVARNVIAGHAAIEWEMRPVAEADADYIKTEVDRFAAEVLEPEMRRVDPQASISRSTVAEVVGLEPHEGCRAVALATALTGRNATGLVAFGTEAGLFQGLGMDCVVCGPGSIEQAHKPDEFIARSELVACMDMLAGLEPFVTKDGAI